MTSGRLGNSRTNSRIEGRGLLLGLLGHGLAELLPEAGERPRFGGLRRHLPATSLARHRSAAALFLAPAGFLCAAASPLLLCTLRTACPR